MRQVEIDIPASLDEAQLVLLLEGQFKKVDLTITLKVSTKQYPGSLHWHLKKGTERGTLEVTWWPMKRRLWYKVASGREGMWIDGVLLRLNRDLHDGEDGRASCGASWYK